MIKLPQILIVEDEELVAEDLQRTLTRSGYDVLATVSSGTEALTAMACNPVDLVLLDIRIKGEFDGIETANRMRQLYHLPLIYITAYSDDKTLERAKSTEPYGYLVKPIQSGSLIATISMALHKHDMEKRLRESENRYRDLFENVNDMIMSCSPGGHLLYANPAWHKIMGYDQDELSRLLIKDIFTPESLIIWTKLYQQLLFGQNIEKVELLLTPKSQNPIIVDASLTLRQVDDDIVEIQGVFRDLTESKRLEYEQQLMNTRLRQTQKMESLGLMAGSIAHDFNNLLTIILGYNDLLKLKKIGEEAKATAIREIENAVHRANELTKNMLLYAGQSRSDYELIQLDTLVQDHVNLFESVGNKITPIYYDLSPVAIRGDKSQIRQLLINLVTNASEAGEEVENIITIRTKNMVINANNNPALICGKTLPVGNYALLEVIDQGCGIQPDTISKIFDPFYSTKFLGRGLGLAAVFGIVRGHEGGIEVISAINRGTTIRIYFPSSKRETTAVSLDRVPDHGSDKWHGSGLILVADDEENILTIVSYLLRQHGFKVLTARNGRDFMEIFARENTTIHAIILDLSMPFKDGKTIAREIRKQNNSVPILLMSGYAEEDVMFDFSGISRVVFMQKPFTPDVLLTKLRELIPSEPAN